MTYVNTGSIALRNTYKRTYCLVDFHKLLRRFPVNLQLRKSFIAIFGLAAIALTSLGFYTQNQEAATPQREVKIAAFPIKVPTMAWGFAVDTLQVASTVIQEGESLSDMLIAAGCTNAQMQKLITNASEVFDLRTMRAGKPLIKLAKDSTQAINYLIYEPSAYGYVVFDLQHNQAVWETKREVITKTVSAAGIIEGSLWNAMIDRGYSYELTAKMEDALQWSVDFHHLQVDDEFRLIFEQDYVEGEPVSVKNVIAAQYKTGETLFHSIYFDNGDPEVTGYYSLEGKPMNAGFLKAPVKYARISSRYNLNRLHPVLKYRRPHYGTDYAAPYGTPIMAVGNGVVTTAGYTKGNGNYVKIRHNETHETQYLHMQKYAEGIRSGVPVKQGQVIGYVGSTGLATGPHVCFRFWQNGKQVNHLSLELPPAKPLPDSLMPAFISVRDQFVPQLEKVVPVAIERPIEEPAEETAEVLIKAEAEEKNP